VSLTRRSTLAGLIAVAPAVEPVAEDTAPPASEIAAWSVYEARLRDRLADAGGGRFDEPGARAAFALANRARAAAGAGPLGWHDELGQTARAHAGDLANRGAVEHLSPEGFDPSHRLWLIGRTTIGSPSENIAYHRRAGPPLTPAQLLAQWRASRTGHWQNLLRPSHTHAAFALVRGSDQALLVALFCRPLASLPEPLPFQAHGVDIAQAIRSLDAELRPRLSPPQGCRRGTAAGGRRVMQISARREGPDGPDYIGGPIFLPTL
jgi:uncharacterized protein YkwD